MNFVEPIRDRKKIAQIKNQLRGQHRYRDLLLFVVGINTALRISDLLELRVEHFLDDHQHIKPRFWIKEQKRGKRQEVVVNASIRASLEEYFAAYPEVIGDQNNFTFFNTKDNGFLKPIKRGKPGKSLPLFVNKWVCVATSAHTVCEKHGAITLVCKVLI